MKETDKGYAEWVAMSDELAKIKRRFASLQIAMVISLGVLISREPAKPPAVTDADLENARACYLRNHKTEERLDTLEREWQAFKEVRVERERCPTSKKARNECANCQQVWLYDHAEWQHVTNAIHTIQLGTGLAGINSSDGVVTINCTAGGGLIYDGTALGK